MQHYCIGAEQVGHMFGHIGDGAVTAGDGAVTIKAGEVLPWPTFGSKRARNELEQNRGRSS
jgi:hypothetical protein